MLKPYDLRCEYRRNPLGIDAVKPRLFWKLASDETDVMQRAYQIQVAGSERDLSAEHLLWDSGIIVSDRSIHIEYHGPALASRQRCFWRIRAWDTRDKAGAWSETAFWEMGLLGESDWQALMIAPLLEEDKSKSEPCPMLRKEFSVGKSIVRARLYITAHGLYEARINGARVGDDLFTPGWTPYHSCLQYQTYDVTALLKEGSNAIGVILADGWYRGYISYSYDRNVYGDRLALFSQLEVEYGDGAVDRIVSDMSWKCATGALRSSDIFNGETFDATKELKGWDAPGHDDSSWQGFEPIVFDKAILAAQRGEPVKRTEELKSIAILKTPKGETVIDFGQNLTGWVRLKARGERGTEITILHGEVLDQQGNFYNENLRMAKATDRYILAGAGDDEVLEPRFTFHGFRYAKVEGYPGVLNPEEVAAVVIHTNLERTGDFSCSNELVNRLHKNIVWSQRGNFLDVPTDCPQRDERMGWTGDIQIFAPTACLNMNSAAFFGRWLRDLGFEQTKSGAVPMVVPDPYFNRIKTLGRIISHMVVRREGDEKDFFDELFALFVLNYSVGWGDAAIIVPWRLYQVYGDRRLLEEQYESMRSLFRFHLKKSGGLGSLLQVNPVKWLQPKTWKLLKYYYTAIGFGDWLAPGDGMGGSIFKSIFYLPTVYLALDALILAKTAAVLGKPDDAAYYESIHEKTRDAFRHFKMRKDGRLSHHRQTAYVLALMARLVPETERENTARMLAEMVRKSEHRLGTGFLGTPHICRVLCEYGYVDDAYRLLLNEDHQWLYQVKKGATTVWEHWDAIKPDGSFQPARMLSFNHYGYGAIGAWLYQDIAGINFDEEQPGYKKIIIRPMPSEAMTWAKAEYESIHGMIKSGWKRQGESLVISAAIPPNTRGILIVPAGYTAVSLNGSAVGNENRSIEIGSGSYELACAGKSG